MRAIYSYACNRIQSCARRERVFRNTIVRSCKIVLILVAIVLGHGVSAWKMVHACMCLRRRRRSRLRFPSTKMNTENKKKLKTRRRSQTMMMSPDQIQSTQIRVVANQMSLRFVVDSVGQAAASPTPNPGPPRKLLKLIMTEPRYPWP